MDHIKNSGKIYLDWGFGDHWRFDNYKVGWLKDNEHEWHYSETNYLWSGYWDDDLLDDSEVKLFEKYIKKLGYIDLKQAVIDETPSLFNLKNIDINYKVHTKFLWPDCPQLYILLEIDA